LKQPRWQRFEAYKSARSLCEALRLGATERDLLEDLTKDLVQLVGQPLLAESDEESDGSQGLPAASEFGGSAGGRS